MRPFVQLPTKTTSTFWPRIAWPGRRSMYSSARSRARRWAGSRLLVGRGHVARDRDAHARVGAVGDHRFERVGIDGDGLVERRPVVGREGSPAPDRVVPGGAGRGMRPPGQVLEGRVVRGDQAGPRAALDAHVADRHPLFHGQGPDRLAPVLEDVAGPAADADARDEVQDDVLGAHAGREPPVDADLVGQRIALEERLGREDHLHLARPDPERECAERAVRARVRIAADDGHARLGEPELRTDDVDDALARRADAVERDAELGAVRLELADLGGGHLVEDRQVARRRRDGVVGGRDRLPRPADAQPARPKAGERLWAGDLVDEVQVDREDRRGARGPA